MGHNTVSDALLALTDWRTDRLTEWQRNKYTCFPWAWGTCPHFAWAGGTKTNTKISFSFWLTLFYSIPLLALTDRRIDRDTCFAWAGGTCPCFAWAGGTIFPVVLLCQFFVLAGNRFWSYFWRLRPEKKDTVVCLAGCAVVSVFGSGGKLAVLLLWLEIFITTRKKVPVVCLASARSLLRPEKKDTVVCQVDGQSLLRPETK